MLTLFDETKSVPVGHYDAEMARRKRDEGMARAELGAAEHIGDDWNERAMAAVKTAARVMKYLIVEDVWPFVGDELREGRAMEPVMQRAARAGIIQATGNYRTSARVSCHGNPRAEYKSLLFDEVGG